MLTVGTRANVRSLGQSRTRAARGAFKTTPPFWRQAETVCSDQNGYGSHASMFLGPARAKRPLPKYEARPMNASLLIDSGRGAVDPARVALPRLEFSELFFQLGQCLTSRAAFLELN